MPPLAGNGAVTVVVRSRPGGLARLADVLYSIAAQSGADAPAVVVQSEAVEHRRGVADVVRHLDGLLDIRTTSLAVPADDPAAAYDAGLELVTTPLCCFVDDNELLYPRHARLLGDALTMHPDALAAHGGGRLVTGVDTPTGFIAETKRTWDAEKLARARLMVEPCVALCATLLRVDAMRRLGIRFTDGWSRGGAWAALRKVAVHGRLIAVDVAVCEHRLGPGESPAWPFPEVAAEPPDLLRLEAEAVAVAGVTDAELAETWWAHRGTLERERARTAAAEASEQHCRRDREWLERRVEELEQRLAEAERPRPVAPGGVLARIRQRLATRRG